MPIDNWGTPLRDVLVDADIVFAPAEINEKFQAFFRADGHRYSAPYDEINAHLPDTLSPNRVETWKKLFDTVGLLYVDEGRVRISRFGRLFGGEWERLAREAAGARRVVAESAVGVLGRYQLLNPTTLNRGYPPDCDVLPYRVIWAAMLRLGDLHWEELHRVLLKVMKQADLESALIKIEQARASSGYNPNDRASASAHLGPAIYSDGSQATRRMTPWFSVAGFGGMLIDREATHGRRRLNPEFVDLIASEVATPRPWIDFGTDQEGWFSYLDEGVKTLAKTSVPELPVIADDDPIYQAVVDLVIKDNMGGALLLGAPGTGKSWYARQIALKLTSGKKERVREVQFHPSYQYEDFVEGYVPDAKEGFRLADKHLLEMAEVARQSDGPVVLIIDEFSRTDPARVLGETMTYMEGSLRDAPFFLPSGRQATIPKNLIFLATMNPDDRSVDEIDAAMDRRWAKIMLQPSSTKVNDFLVANATPDKVRAPAMELFARLQDHLDVGHAFFRNVRDADSLERLWTTQLKFLVKKRFRFDPGALQEIEALWATCAEAIATPAAGPLERNGSGTQDEAPEGAPEQPEAAAGA
ncbi:MoxR-like ATPase [Brevundimonas sp. 1080]|uniref:McrB family protein n=1 Tax=Brevundimonas sp. 1080 TaxID=3156405 RepID=UPI003397519E